MEVPAPTKITVTGLTSRKWVHLPPIFVQCEPEPIKVRVSDMKGKSQTQSRKRELKSNLNPTG